jgi:hypothetical protein
MPDAAAKSSPKATRPSPRLTVLRIVVSIGIAAGLCALSPLFILSWQSSPGTEDAHRYLVFKPGRTIPARSLDAAGNGASYHFTRYDSYKAPDWRPSK